ncbi:MAG: YggS family pyridoxal phosphate-dependent enzyme [Alphaproteobacteria bacterium]|nr:YggS family pyridoxal phosphate-dependent enzyme [Alphaproteobacteria bacterium]
MPSQNSEPATVSLRTAENLKSVYARIEAARRSAVAPAAEIRLIAVSKTHPAERIVPVLDAGHRIFGENRVQEAKSKWPELRARYPGIELHLIGALQTNKVREAVALFDVVHSLDRLHLAEVLKNELERSRRAVRLLVQVNTGQEPQKGGIAPRETVDFVRHCRDELLLPVIGLMCIPPPDEEPALHFALLRKLADECGLEFLSMGMSDDFETAIRFGATHVRIGTAIFGAREGY